MPLEGRIKCPVSTGTGIPSLEPFRNDVFRIGLTPVGIATETERSAERFLRDKIHLSNTGLYYRFNVKTRLKDIGLEKSKKKEIAAATRRYLGSQNVIQQMQACTGNVSGRECQFQVSIEGVLHQSYS